MFRRLLAARVEMFAAIKADLRTGTFARAGSRLLREKLNDTANLPLLANLKDLILVIGAYVQKELPKDRVPQPKDYDRYFLLISELFMAVLREAIQKAEPRTKVLHSPLLKDQEPLKVILHSFLIDNASLSSSAASAATSNSISSSTSLVEWTRVVFDIKKEDHRRTLAQLKKTAAASEIHVFSELKTQLDEIVRNQCPGAGPADFQTTQAYDAWKSRQTQLLQVLMKTFLQRFPNTVHNLGSAGGSAPSTATIPRDPRATYRVLLETCLKHDMQNASQQAGQQAAFSLSKLSVALLSECGLRWKLPKEYKDIVLLDLLVTHYNSGTLIEDDLFPRFKSIVKSSRGVEAWTKQDRQYYVSVLDSLNTALHNKLRHFANMLGWKEKTPDGCNSTMQLIGLLLTELCDDQAWRTEHPEWTDPGRLEELVREELLEAINTRYRACSDLVSGIPREIIRLTTSVKAVNSDITNYRIYFRDPIFNISVTLIAAETCLKYFILEMENMRFSLQGDFQIAEMLDLYQVVKLLRDMCDESLLPIVKNFDVESWFAPFISQWLTLTDQKWLEWAKSAVTVEKYEPYFPPLSMHSTSVMDLFTCFHAGLDFIEKLAWRESAKKDRLVKDFIKMMSKSLQEYVQMMWEEFEVVDTEHSDKPVAFSYQSCIKLNNMIAAHSKLNDILSKLPTTSTTSRSGPLTIHPDAARNEPEKDKSTISITLLRATNLAICDWTTSSSDPYIVLSHAGTELHRTRVVYKTLNPAYNQTFQLHVPHSLHDTQSFLDLVVYDRDVIGKDDLCGSASVFLRDSKLEDFLAHDLTLALKPQGKIMVRITRAGEIDDPAFWTRKAQQCLVFAIEDMIRVYTDQATRVARAALAAILPATPTRRRSGVPSTSTTSTAVTTPPPNIESIQTKLEPLLCYLDTVLGLWNEALDRRLLNAYLVDTRPYLADPHACLTHPAVDTREAAGSRGPRRTQTRAAKRGATLAQKKNGSNSSNNYPNNTSSNDGSINDDDETALLARPCILAKHVWSELARCLNELVATYIVTETPADSTTTTTTTSKQPPPPVVTTTISHTLELLKTLFACPHLDDPTRLAAYPIDELEGVPAYDACRDLLDRILKGRF
ncbi:hypothetical protein DFJ77DRAFT_488843 [Powellomyces hirtus]|nr:hypothetical protein DFJ77DRAFT_488843 [Powellomyces hirtus]